MRTKFIASLLIVGLLVAGIPSISQAHDDDPEAQLVVEEDFGDYWTLFFFDASSSYDEETHLPNLLFRWDFDYTGSRDDDYNTDWGIGTTMSHYFDETGEFDVRVEVMDEKGQIDEAFVEIEIHWASEYMKQLRDRDIMTGYANTGGEMAPDNDITRAELVKMALMATGFNHYHYFAPMGYFPDVSGTEWHYFFIESAYEMGLVDGYDDGLFRPNEPITRAEALKIVLEAFDVSLHDYHDGRFEDVDDHDWYADYIETAYDHDLIDGYSNGYFRPNQSITRGETAKIVALALDEFEL